MAEESSTPYSCMNTPICASGSETVYFKPVTGLPFTKTDHSICLLPALFYKSITRDILGQTLGFSNTSQNAVFREKFKNRARMQ